MGVIDYLIRRRVKALEDKAQVFEVTDLLIPAGTTTAYQHVLGTVTLFGRQFVEANTHLELDHAVAVGRVTLYVTPTDPDSFEGNWLTGARVDGPNVWAHD